MSNLAHDVAGGGVTEPPVSPPVMGAPDRGPSDVVVNGGSPFGADELKTLPIQALLVRSGALTIEQLSEALRVNVASGQSVEDIAIERGWVSAEHVAQLVAAKQAAIGEPAPAAEPAAVAAEPIAPEQPVAPLQPIQPPEPQPVQPQPVQEFQPVQPAPQTPAVQEFPPVQEFPAVQPAQEFQPVQEFQPAQEFQPVQPEPMLPIQPLRQPEPVPTIEPVQPQPAEPAQPVQVAPQPEAAYAEPAPALPVAPSPASLPLESEQTVGVFLNLTDGQRIWVGRYATESDAELRAQEVIQAFIRPEPGVWPRFGGRFIRPDAVVSVELSARRDD